MSATAADPAGQEHRAAVELGDSVRKPSRSGPIMRPSRAVSVYTTPAARHARHVVDQLGRSQPVLGPTLHPRHPAAYVEAEQHAPFGRLADRGRRIGVADRDAAEHHERGTGVQPGQRAVDASEPRRRSGRRTGRPGTARRSRPTASRALRQRRLRAPRRDPPRGDGVAPASRNLSRSVGRIILVDGRIARTRPGAGARTGRRAHRWRG